MRVISLPPEEADYTSQVVYQKTFTPEECDKIINFHGTNFTSTIYTDDQNSHYYNPEIRQMLIKPLTYNEETSWMFERLKKMALDANETYFNFNITSMFETQILQYDVGGFFSLHSDIGNGRPSTRKITLVTLLSDKSEYEGGKVTFVPPAKPFDFDRGTTMVFPSYILHAVAKVTKGRRYTMETIVHGPPFR